MVSYCDGTASDEFRKQVLILIVMDNGLLHASRRFDSPLRRSVLILIVMDNGLLRDLILLSVEVAESLNPYCNG